MNSCKFYPILFVCLLLAKISSFAQITLPDVKHIVIDKNNEIVGTYIPHGDFSRRFPDFVKDGKYFFDYKDYYKVKFNKNFDAEFYGRGEDEYFDSKKYPAIFTESSHMLSNKKTYIIKYEGGEVFQGRLVWATMRSFSAYNLFEIENNKKYKLDDKIHEIYNAQNAVYKKDITDLMTKKGATSFVISNFLTNNYPEGEFKYDDLIFHFNHVSYYCWDKDEPASSNWFPSFVRYNLIVENVYGEALKQYNQIVFLEAKLGRKASHYYSIDKIINATMPSGFESLINQFVNDQQLQTKITADDKAVAQKINADKAYEIYTQNKIRYAELRSKKNYLIGECKSVGGSYESIVANIDDNKKIVSKVAATPTTDSRLNAAGGLAMGAILGGMDRAEMNRDVLKLTAVDAAIKNYNTQENTFISSLNNQPANPYTAQLIDEIKAGDEQLGNAMDKLVISQQNAISGTNQAYKDLNSTYLNQLNNQMQNLRSGGNAETSAVTAAGGSKGTTDVCMQQAASAWKSSMEYRRYLQTKLNADASACKAKMIELTIQYCGDKLSAADVAGLKRAAIAERKTESELRGH